MERACTGADAGDRGQVSVTCNYQAFGLTLSLPFPCPVLCQAPEGSIPDVTVIDGQVPKELAAPHAGTPRWQAEPDRFLLRGGRRSGRFLVEGGSLVTLQRSRAAEDEILAFHFLDAVLAAVLRQRGLLVLHAGAAVFPATAAAIAFSGESGSGKSTTLAALLREGCLFLADDVTALRLCAHSQIEVLPGVPQMHLTEDAAEGLGQDISGLPRYAWRRMKAAVPAKDALAAGTHLLRTLFLLRVSDGRQVRLQTLTGGAKFAALQDCVFGPMLPQEHPSLFPLFAALVEQVAVVRVERPAGQWTVEAIVRAVCDG
jgi:hypothetical protein